MNESGDESYAMTSEEEPVAMAGPDVRMAGYLDKRGKMKLVSTWKRYWFVLKDQLLLYYKSQLECLNLSACRGSLNMGLASCVRPGAHRGPPSNGAQGFTIEVVTRTQVITLRTKDRGLQEQWLKALLDSMAHPNISTPVRNSTGPMHFRYSLDNLPTADELEKEDKAKEKQSTLPHRTGINRHDSVLGKIKKMGGHSYGGSLDTILKRRPNNSTTTPPQRSPQQPKIPRIKAVDRMIGLHYDGKQEESSSEDPHSLDESNLGNGELHLNGSANAVHEDSSRSDEEMGTSYDGDSPRNLSANMKETQGIDKSSTKSESVAEEDKGVLEGVAVVKRDENQNHEDVKYKRIEETKFSSNTVDENRVSSLTVENKLYEKTKRGEENAVNDVEYNQSEVVNKLYEKTEITDGDGKVVIESNVSENTKEESEVNKDYDSEEELSSFQQKLESSDEKIYEVVPGGAVKQDEKDSQSEVKLEEDEYYCDYDKVSLMQSLSDQRGSSPEPALPPRPAAKTEDEDPDYSVYCDTTSTDLSPNAKSSSEVQSSGKKESKLREKKSKKKKKKSSSVESVSSEEPSSNKKKKRKMSFLQRVLKQYRKKPESDSDTQTAPENPVSCDEPEYETVDYTVAIVNHTDTTEEKRSSTACDDSSSTNVLSESSPEKEVPKERLVGSKCLLSQQAMLELRMKLKGRDDAMEAGSAAPVKEETEGHACSGSDDLPEKKPVPRPRPSKQKSVQDQGGVGDSLETQCSETINRSNKPPSLPPRRVGRPSSPWHDVPKNNSPIYGNFQDLGIEIAERKEEEAKESPEPTSEKQSAPQAGEWDQEGQDEFGFAYIQKKWKAAEKSCEQSRDQRRGSKGRLSVQKSPQSPESAGKKDGFKFRHTRSSSSESGGSNVLNQEIGANDIYSDVNKEHLSAKTIIKCLNARSERVAGKDCDLNEEADRGTDKADSSGLARAESMKSEHSELVRDRHSTHYRDQSDDEGVVLRKSYCGNILLCNKRQVTVSETEHSRVAVGESEHFRVSETGDSRAAVSETAGDSRGINYQPLGGSSSGQACFERRFSNELGDKMHNGNGCCVSTMYRPAATKEFADKTVDTSDYEEYEDIRPLLNRHSDELNLLLAQLAEITSAPLLPPGAAISLRDLPDGRKPKVPADQPSELCPAQPESFVLGPIRRRRHSDPDYDVPRPHGSLLHLLTPHRASSRSSGGGTSQSGQESDAIEATRFFGEADLTSNSARSSLSLRHSVISEVDDQQSDSSYYVSMAPDSLEVPSIRSMD